MRSDTGGAWLPPPVTIALLRRLWRGRRARRALDARPPHAEPPHAGPPHAGPGLRFERRPFALGILDVRPAAEFLAGHLPHAVSLPAEELDARVHELPPKARAFLVVAGEPRSAAGAAGRLRERGWLACRALDEPLAAWPGPWEPGPARTHLWEPSPLVRRFARALPPGPVIDLGCGAGRDAVFLSLQGHPVIAVDRLPEALAMAGALAARYRARLDTAHMDLRRTEPPAAGDLASDARPRDSTPEDGYAAVLMIRFFERELRAWVARALRPGGLLVLEAYLARDLPAHARPPRTRLAPQEALALFTAPEFEPCFYEETVGGKDEALVRLVARRAAGRTPGDARSGRAGEERHGSA